MHAVSKSNFFHSAFHIKKDFLVEINPFVHINPLPDNKVQICPNSKPLQMKNVAQIMELNSSVMC